MRHVLLAIVAAAGLAMPLLADGHAQAGESRSRILDSPSRSVIYRNQPTTRSIVPGGDRSASQTLGERIGGLSAAGRTGVPGEAGGAGARNDARPMRTYDCVLHHERLERSTRQLFSTRCDPTVDVDTGYPAHTTR